MLRTLCEGFNDGYGKEHRLEYLEYAWDSGLWEFFIKSYLFAPDYVTIGAIGPFQLEGRHGRYPDLKKGDFPQGEKLSEIARRGGVGALLKSLDTLQSNRANLNWLVRHGEDVSKYLSPDEWDESMAIQVAQKIRDLKEQDRNAFRNDEIFFKGFKQRLRSDFPDVMQYHEAIENGTYTQFVMNAFKPYIDSEDHKFVKERIANGTFGVYGRDVVDKTLGGGSSSYTKSSRANGSGQEISENPA